MSHEAPDTARLARPAQSRQPERVTGGDVTYRGPGIQVAFRPDDEGTVLEARVARWRGRSLTAELYAAHPPDHETLNVVVPWSERQFQFTSKHNTRQRAAHCLAISGRGSRVEPRAPSSSWTRAMKR